LPVLSRPIRESHMSRRSVLVAIAAVAMAIPVLAQYNIAGGNSFQMSKANGTLNVFGWGTTTASVGNVNGSGVVNTTVNDMYHWTILPAQYMKSSNGTSPGTMELVSVEQALYKFEWGVALGVPFSPDLIWDQTISQVTLTNPTTGLVDGGHYPDVTLAPVITFLGGPAGFPVPAPPCPGTTAVIGYQYTITFGTATPGSGLNIPAAGNDLAWVSWAPNGMTRAPTDGCEIGGTGTTPGLGSVQDRSPANLTTPAGFNPNCGRRFNGTVSKLSNLQSFMNWPGFREPILQPRYTSTSTVPVAFSSPEVGAGALHQDAQAVGVVVSPGFRTQCTGHLGNLVVHVLTADIVNYPALAQPGIAVTGTANLLLNPADPNFFLLTPAMDTLATFLPNASSEFVEDKDVADTATPIGLTGPFAAPGITYYVQSFVVDISVSPVTAISSNLCQGNLY